MPGYDGTGPEGTGAPGWGRGPCGNGGGQINRRGLGLGRGRRGSRRFLGFMGSRQALSGREALEAEKSWLERRLSTVTNALKDKEE